jgi:hypothetical protein
MREKRSPENRKAHAYALSMGVVLPSEGTGRSPCNPIATPTSYAGRLTPFPFRLYEDGGRCLSAPAISGRPGISVPQQ